jgi:hypothetical protein
MAARSTRILFHNQTEFSLRQTAVDLPHGEWTNPWQPPGLINPHGDAEWRSESDGIATGTEGSVRFSINNGEGASAYVHWDNPFDGKNKYHQFTDDKFEIFHGGGDGNDTTVEFFLLNSIPHFVSGFKPSIHGFHFSNSKFGEVPYTLPPLRGTPLDLKYGNAKNGLCGGMVYTVRDYYEASGVISDRTTPPLGEQEPLFIYIVNRLFDSFDIDDITLYLKYMNPAYPDTDENIAGSVGAADGRAFIMANVEFPIIRQDILTGHLSPMGLIMIKSLNPSDLGRNHQVMAYGYQMKGNNVEIYLYDPNSPDTDSIKLSFNAASTANKIDVTHNVNAKGPVYCFFRTNYSFKKPSPQKSSLRIFANIHHFNPQSGLRNFRPSFTGFRNSVA